MDRPTFSLGIEEEYLVVDRETRDLVSSPGEGFFEACREAQLAIDWQQLEETRF